MKEENLRRALVATGYWTPGASQGASPAANFSSAAGAGLALGEAAQAGRLGPALAPDARWRSASGLHIYFKWQPEPPPEETVERWRREIWNEGFAPLLWVVSPDRVELYNGYGPPLSHGDAERHRLASAENSPEGLCRLNALAGRLAVETGLAWYHRQEVERRASVDQRLLQDFLLLEDALAEDGLERRAAQALIARLVFSLFLLERGFLAPEQLRGISGHSSLAPLLRDGRQAEALFAWLEQTCHGQLLPDWCSAPPPAPRHYRLAAGFLEGRGPGAAQLLPFPFQFGVMPTDCFAALCGHFFRPARERRSLERTDSRNPTGYYAREPLAMAALTAITQGCTGQETLLDLSCGTGLYLACGLRRLAALGAGGKAPSRERLCRTLTRQLQGVDCDPNALSIAAYSLYLTLMELDPARPADLCLPPLLGQTLRLADAQRFDSGGKRYDLIVGNPPWALKSQTAGARRGSQTAGLDLVAAAARFAHRKTRFAFLLAAHCLYEQPPRASREFHPALRQLAPLTLVNLASQREWLVATQRQPAMLLLAGLGEGHAGITLARVRQAYGDHRIQALDLKRETWVTVPLAAAARQPWRLLAASRGQAPDLWLLDRLERTHQSLGQALAGLGAVFRLGQSQAHLLQVAGQAAVRQAPDGAEELEYLRGPDLKEGRLPAEVSERLPGLPASFLDGRYRAPLLLVKPPGLQSAQLPVAVAERDLAYSADFRGLCLAPQHRSKAWLLAGILSSSLAAWHLWLTAFETSLIRRRFSIRRLGRLPLPDLDQALETLAGRRILEMARAWRRRPQDLAALDSAVFDLYQLSEAERLVIADGLQRSHPRWETHQQYGVQPVSSRGPVLAYAATLCAEVERQLPAGSSSATDSPSATGAWLVRAEVSDLPLAAPLRQVRCSLVRDPSQAGACLAPVADKELPSGKSPQLPASPARGRRVQGPGGEEAIIVKRPLRHYWLDTAAIEDAGALVAAGFARGLC